MNNWTVYEHISPSGKIYVGITSLKPKARWENGSGYKRCVLFYRAIQKYGWDSIQHNIIATCLGEGTAKNMEKDLIAFNKAKGISYNITDGGDGTLGVPCSELKRQQTGNIWKGKKIPKEIAEKSAAARRGRKCSREHVENIRKSKIGNGNRNKAVIEIKNGKIINEYKSCVEAANAIGVHPNCVSRCCRRETQTCNNHIFIYKCDLPLLWPILGLHIDVIEKNPYIKDASSEYVEIIK